MRHFHSILSSTARAICTISAKGFARSFGRILWPFSLFPPRGNVFSAKCFHLARSLVSVPREGKKEDATTSADRFSWKVKALLWTAVADRDPLNGRCKVCRIIIIRPGIECTALTGQNVFPFNQKGRFSQLDFSPECAAGNSECSSNNNARSIHSLSFPHLRDHRRN